MKRKTESPAQRRGQVPPIPVSITLKFQEGRLLTVGRRCRIHLPSCEDCKWKAWCDAVEKTLREAIEKSRRSSHETRKK